MSRNAYFGLAMPILDPNNISRLDTLLPTLGFTPMQNDVIAHVTSPDKLKKFLEEQSVTTNKQSGIITTPEHAFYYDATDNVIYDNGGLGEQYKAAVIPNVETYTVPPFHDTPVQATTSTGNIESITIPLARLMVCREMAATIHHKMKSLYQAVSDGKDQNSIANNALKVYKKCLQSKPLQSEVINQLRPISPGPSKLNPGALDVNRASSANSHKGSASPSTTSTLFH